MRKSKTRQRNRWGPIRWTLSKEEKKTIEAHNNWVIARKNGKKTRRHKAR